MNKFILYLINGKIQVYQVTDSPILLSWEGEEWFEYDANFWERFKQKLDYQDEPLSFIIVSDEELKIPEEIKIAKQSAFEDIPILKQYSHTKIISLPKIKLNPKQVIQKQQPKKNFLDFYLEETNAKRGKD